MAALSEEGAAAETPSGGGAGRRNLLKNVKELPVFTEFREVRKELVEVLKEANEAKLLSKVRGGEERGKSRVPLGS